MLAEHPHQPNDQMSCTDKILQVAVETLEEAGKHLDEIQEYAQDPKVPHATEVHAEHKDMV